MQEGFDLSGVEPVSGRRLLLERGLCASKGAGSRDALRATPEREEPSKLRISQDELLQASWPRGQARTPPDSFVVVRRNGTDRPPQCCRRADMFTDNLCISYGRQVVSLGLMRLTLYAGPFASVHASPVRSVCLQQFVKLALGALLDTELQVHPA